ncbi:flagellar basal-body rod protein FlgG [Zhaonella formicivorans]|uniref:flagellar basal-body rod protein FlgG n=1 Tax=Zhaonella formicivorans TaxID=2528593 RepID=UPI0010E567F5|nr:flagellar basal-body rod protein FlgG [Zhaonella formicivorans]
MLRSLWNGASGMAAHAAKMDIVANNLANVNTTAYKKQKAAFTDLLYQRIGTTGQPVRESSSGPALSGSGVKLTAVSGLFTQGPIISTGRELDVAIRGNGFMEVELPNGQLAYTRDGNLQVDGEGTLVHSSGFRLSAQVMVPAGAKKLVIAPNGSITATLEDGTREEIGVLPLYRFNNPGGLMPIGQNLFVSTEESGAAWEEVPGQSGMGTFQQGMLEGSNVNLVEEMTQMIIAQRAYQFNSRSVQVADEMWGMANNLRK